MRALFAYDISHPDRLVELGITDLTTIDSYAGTVELIVELTPDWAHPELAEPTHLQPTQKPKQKALLLWLS